MKHSLFLKAEFLVEAYVSDAFLDENINTPASMKVEIPSCGSQSEYEGKILSLFTTSNAKILGCEEEEWKPLWLCL